MHQCDQHTNLPLPQPPLDFLYDTDILAIGRHLYCDLDLWPMTLNIWCHMIKLSTNASYGICICVTVVTPSPSRSVYRQSLPVPPPHWPPSCRSPMTSLMFPRLFPHSLAACGHKYGRGASGAGVGAVANWLHHVETSHAPAHRQTERHRKTIRWTPSLLRLSFDAKTGTQCHVASAVVSSRAADWVVFSIMEWPHAARNAIRCNLYDGGDEMIIITSIYTHNFVRKNCST